MGRERSRTTLVTGGAGFIGSHLVERLVERGDHVVVVDNLSTGRLENLERVPPDRLSFIEASVTEAMPELTTRQFDEIYHLAAAVGVRLVVEQPIQTIETNVMETSELLRFAAERGTPFLLASTSEIYGKSLRTPFAETDDVVYGPTTFHRWSYACSKAIDEYLALAYAREHALPVVIARLFNTVGPRQIGSYGMVLPRFVAAARAGEPLQVYGDGRQTRCFCDVREIAPLLVTMLANEACLGKVLNVGRDEPISIRDLAALVIEVLESDSPVEHVANDEVYGPGFEDLRERRPDLSRLCAATGFSPRIPLEQTIRDLADTMALSAASMDP